MAFVTYRNLLDSESEFVEVKRDQLISAIYDYARTYNELYQLIMKEKVCIYVNNKVVPVDYWAGYELCNSDYVIIAPIIVGGDGGFLKVIIGVVLIVAAIVTYQYELMPAIAGWTAAQASAYVAFSVGMMGAMTVLGGLTQSMFSPDLPSIPSLSGMGGNLSSGAVLSGGGKQTQTYNWSGINTIARYNTPVPIVYGTHSVGGNIVSFFTSVENKTDDYLYMLIALSEGEIDGICLENNCASVCTTSNRASSAYRAPAIEINGQHLSNFTDVEWWYRKGTNVPTSGTLDVYDPAYQDKIPNFDGARIQYVDGRELTTAGIVYSTTKPVDMVEMQVSAPSLYKNEGGQIVENKVEYKVEYKTADSGTYTVYDHGGGTVSTWSPTVSATAGNVGNVSVSYTDGSSFKYYNPGVFTIEVLGNNFSERVSQYWNYTTVMYSITISITNELTGQSQDIEIVQNVNQTHGEVQEPYIAYYAPVGQNEHFMDLNPWDTEAKEPWWYLEFGTYYYCPISDRAYQEPEGNVCAVKRYNTVLQVTGQQHSYTSKEIGDYKVTITHNAQVGDKFSVYSDETTNNTVVGQWIPLQGKATSTVSSKVVIDLNQFGSGLDRYDIRVSRRYERSSDINVSDSLVLKSITEVVQGQFIYPNTALLGLKMKATGQLSGGVPNVVTTIRGIKIDAPSMSSGRFEDCFWDDTNQVWVNLNGDTITWDESTYSKVWSNNTMLCVRDLLLNRRYGLGKYLTTNDLYSSGIVSAIKECHIEFDPYYSTNPDYLSWWDGGNDSDWASNWKSTGHITSDVTARTVTHGGYNHSIGMTLDLDSTLPVNTSFSFSITTASATTNFKAEIWGKAPNGDMYHLKTTGFLSNGTNSTVFTHKLNIGIDKLYLTLVAEGNGILTGTISDISMTATIRDYNHTWNGVFDSDQSALAALFETCDSFRCWPIWFGGKYNFIVDKDETPSEVISVGDIVENEFSQSFTPLSEIPYILVGQYSDRDYKYNLRTVTTSLDALEVNKTNEKTVGLKGITDRRKAERELRYKLNKISECTNVNTFKCGLDKIHSTAGDVVYIQHPLPSWGYGGRVTNYNSASKFLFLEATMTVTNAATDTYLVRWQTASNTMVTATVNTASMGNCSTSLLFITTWPANNPATDAIYAAGVVADMNKKIRLLSVTRDTADTVSVVALSHVASVYTANATLNKISNANIYIPPVYTPPVPPTNIFVGQANRNDGIGFVIQADPPLGNYNIKDIVVQMTSNDDTNYKTIAVIPINQNEFIYLDNNLELNKTYYFKFFCRTDQLISSGVYTTCFLDKNVYKLDSPTGLKVKNTDPLSEEFDGKDVYLVWNDVTYSHLLSHYTIEVYKTSTSSSYYLLRTAETRSNEYTYSFENNMEDSNNEPNYTLLFLVYAVTIHGVISAPSQTLTVTNSVPDTISGTVSTDSVVGGAAFAWNVSAEQDHKCYSYKIKVGAGAWSDYSETDKNYLTYSITASDIVSYGAHPVVYLGVKDKDVYTQVSATAVIASVIADRNSDNIFKLIASKSAGSGTLSDLYNGVLTSGGITVG